METRRPPPSLDAPPREEGSEGVTDLDKFFPTRRTEANVVQSPVLALWPRMTATLQSALYGALAQHGIVSTRKAVAAIRGVDEEVRRFLGRLDEIAPRAETVPPSQDSTPRTPPSPMPPTFKCSSCVESAAQSFLDEGAELGWTESAEIDAKAFFVRLVRVSTGEFMHWWRKAGLTEDVVAAHLLQVSTLLVDGDEPPVTPCGGGDMIENDFVNVTMD